MAQPKIELVRRTISMDDKFIYVFDDEVKNELLSKGFRILKEDSKPFIFDNNGTDVNFSNIDSEKFCFSDTMLF